MKKGLYIVIAVIVALALVGCGVRTRTAKAGTADREGEPVLPSQTQAARITRAEAKTAALTHAGVAEAQTRDLEAELENTRGGLYYEVTFEAGGYEYDYLIDITSGSVVHSEKEVDR